MWFPKKNSSPQGANERVLPTDFRSVFIFFLTLIVDFSFSIKVFKNQRGGPLDEKNLKEIDFYVWYLKRTALKNVDWMWNRFLKILIFGEVMDQIVPKIGISAILVILAIFRHYLVHNFPKNQYFQKPISLLIYIF